MDNAHDELRNEKAQPDSPWFVLIIHVERERIDRRESIAREGWRERLERILVLTIDYF